MLANDYDNVSEELCDVVYGPNPEKWPSIKFGLAHDRLRDSVGRSAMPCWRGCSLPPPSRWRAVLPFVSAGGDEAAVRMAESHLEFEQSFSRWMDEMFVWCVLGHQAAALPRTPKAAALEPDLAAHR